MHSIGRKRAGIDAAHSEGARRRPVLLPWERRRPPGEPRPWCGPKSAEESPFSVRAPPASEASGVAKGLPPDAHACIKKHTLSLPNPTRPRIFPMARRRMKKPPLPSRRKKPICIPPRPVPLWAPAVRRVTMRIFGGDPFPTKGSLPSGSAISGSTAPQRGGGTALPGGREGGTGGTSGLETRVLLEWRSLAPTKGTPDAAFLIDSPPEAAMERI
jgi:hypothetical protein